MLRFHAAVLVVICASLVACGGDDRPSVGIAVEFLDAVGIGSGSGLSTFKVVR